MKKAVFIKSKEENGKCTVTGNLVAINEVKSEKATGFIAVIGNGDKEYFKVGFFNNDKVNYTQRAEKSKLKNSIGKPITIVYTVRGELNLGSSWEYTNSLIKLDEKTCVFFTRVGSVKVGKSGQAIVSLPIGKKPDWYTASFFNTEKFALADNVNKYLKAGDLVVCRTDAVRTLENGMLCTNGRGFDKIY